MLKHKLLILMVATILVSGGLIHAQEQSGEIIGTVVLEDGSAIPGVSVEITGAKLIGAKVSVTNENGTYRLMGIPSGNYAVTFSLEGFKTIKRKGVRVDLGKTFKLDVIMQTGELREEVVVTGQIPMVDVRKSATAINITKEAFSKLPKASRNFLSIATQQAGVNYEREFDNSTGQDGLQFGERNTAISFDGASASENTFFIDGMDTTTMEGGVSGNNLNTDFIEEVQVKSSGYAAEYGGSMGGVISVITRSGGNEYHGDITMYYDADWLGGEPRDVLQLNTINSTLSEFSNYSTDKWNRIEPGVSLGGYLVKDKLWFFGAFMPQFRTRTRVGEFTNDPSHDGEEFLYKETRYNGSVKVTAALGRNLRLSLSGNLNLRMRENQLPSQAGTSDPSDRNIQAWEDWAWDDPGVNAAANLDYSIGNSGFLTVSGGYYRTNSYNSGTAEPPIPRLRFATSNYHFDIPDDLKKTGGYSNVSWASLNESTRDLTRKISAKTDLTLYFNAGGEHVVKMGFGWNQVYMDKINGINTAYWFFYWAQPNGAYNVYTIGDGTEVATPLGFARELGPYGTIADLQSDRFSIYLQDSWTVGDKLTVNYGVRLEREDMPSMDTNHPDASFAFDFFDKIAPRVGFAYDFKGDGSTKVFGSIGLYYDVMKMDMAVGSFGGLKWEDSWYAIGTLDWPQYADYQGWSFTGSTEPILGGQFLEHINHRVPSFDLVQPDIKAGSKMEISLGFQQKINDDVAFTARFLHHRILNVIEDIGVEIAGNENYYIGNPGSTWIDEQYALSAIEGYIPAGRVCPAPTREYYSVQLSLDKKFSSNWLGGATFTWSSLRGIISGLASSDEHGRQNPMVQRYFDAWFLHYDSQMNLLQGPLPTDRPLDFKVYGAYTFDFGMTLGFNAFAKTGTPVSSEFMLGNQQGWYPNGRGDMGRTPFLWQMDLYAEYNIKLGSKFNLNVNANITNITNNKLAQRIYNRLYDDDIARSNDYIVAGFDVNQLMSELGLPIDPRYGTEYYFLPSLAVRLGAKLSF
jgi:hypothetical protein